MKRGVSGAIAAVWVVLVTGSLPFAQGDTRQACADRLKALGQACLQFAAENDGKVPASLSALLYQVYVSDLAAFACPGTGHELAGRDDIDRYSDYVLSPPSSGAGPRPLVQDRSPKNHGGAGINVFYSDGSVRWLAGGAAESVPTPGRPAAPTAAAPPPVQPMASTSAAPSGRTDPAPQPEAPSAAPLGSGDARPAGVVGVPPAAVPPAAAPAPGGAAAAAAGSANPARRARFGFVPGTADGQGFVVVDVSPDSPAARAGLRAGDLVLEMGNRAFYGLRTPAMDVVAFAGTFPPGTPVRLLVQRGMDRHETAITPEPVVTVDAERNALAKAAYDEGRRLMNAGDFARAAASFNQGISLDPSQPVLYTALAEAHFRRHDAKGEIDALRRGVAAAATYRTYTLLGSAYRRADRHDEAIDALSKAVALVPPGTKDGGLHEQLGFSYMKKRRYQEALGQFEAAYAINPRSPAAVYFLGGCHDVLHHRDSAMGFYRDYLALRYGNADWNTYAQRRLDALARGDASGRTTGNRWLEFVDGFMQGLSSSVERQVGGAPAAGAGPGSIPQSGSENLAGVWGWFDGSTVTMSGDGTFSTSARYTGTWRLTDPAARRYSLVWSHGYTDTLTLSPDGRRLDGTNQRGTRVSGTRRAP